MARHAGAAGRRGGPLRSQVRWRRRIDQPTGEGVIEFAVAGGLAGELIDRASPTCDSMAKPRSSPETFRRSARSSTRRSARVSRSTTSGHRDEPHRPAADRHAGGLEEGHVTGTASLSATAKGQLAADHAIAGLHQPAGHSGGCLGRARRLASPSRLSWDGTGLTIDALDVTVGRAARSRRDDSAKAA